MVEHVQETLILKGFWVNEVLVRNDGSIPSPTLGRVSDYV